MEVVDRAGLKIERANSTSGYTRAIFPDEPGAAEELDQLIANVALCGEYGFPVVGIQCFQAAQFGGFSPWRLQVGGRARRLPASEGRFTRRPEPIRAGRRTHARGTLGTNAEDFSRGSAGRRSGGQTRVAMHGNDPPVSSLYGVPQVLYDFAAFDRLFSKCPRRQTG